MGKMETKGIAVFFRFFHALCRDVETQGYCDKAGGSGQECDSKYAREVGMKSDFDYICQWSGTGSGGQGSCSAKTIADAIQFKKPNAANDISGFSELHLFNSFSNFPHTFVGIAMGNFETKGLQFSAFQCSLTSFKVYANWPLMNQIAKRSLSLFMPGATPTNHTVVNGVSLAALLLTKTDVLGKVVDCRKNSNKSVGSSESGDGGWKWNETEGW